MGDRDFGGGQFWKRSGKSFWLDWWKVKYKFLSIKIIAKVYSEELVWERGGRDSCTGKGSSGKGWIHKAA